MTSFWDSTHVNLPKNITGNSVIDTIYLFLIFNQEILLQNNRVYMKFWDTQTLKPLL